MYDRNHRGMFRISPASVAQTDFNRMKRKRFVKRSSETDLLELPEPAEALSEGHDEAAAQDSDRSQRTPGGGKPSTAEAQL